MSSSVVGYDGGRNEKDVERPVERKKPRRKAEPSSKRRIAWPRWTGFRGMTVRDWLPIVGAFLIPVMIAIGTWGITWQQGKIEDQRAKAERELAEQRAQHEALQAYLDQMSTLLLEKDLRNSEEDSEVRTLARARTLTVLRRLDPNRKSELLRFLAEAKLVQRVDERAPVNILDDADLSSANLAVSRQIFPRVDRQPGSANLSGASMLHANLSEADLSEADLSNAWLAGINLSDANLRGANLSNAGLAPAYMSNANLSNANLRGAYNAVNPNRNINGELEVQAASLEGATMPDGSKHP